MTVYPIISNCWYLSYYFSISSKKIVFCSLGRQDIYIVTDLMETAAWLDGLMGFLGVGNTHPPSNIHWQPSMVQKVKVDRRWQIVKDEERSWSHPSKLMNVGVRPLFSTNVVFVWTPNRTSLDCRISTGSSTPNNPWQRRWCKLDSIFQSNTTSYFCKPVVKDWCKSISWTCPHFSAVAWPGLRPSQEHHQYFVHQVLRGLEHLEMELALWSSVTAWT